VEILVTGGAGYIGSHVCVVLLEQGHRITVVDDLSNSTVESLRRIRTLTGKSLEFHRVDIRDVEGLKRVFGLRSFAAVIHFAGLKAVGESIEQPLLYYRTNLGGTLNLLEAMQRHQVRQLVFSSSATVYGEPDRVPIAEDAPLRPMNPYGHTKLMIEQVLRDTAAADGSWRIVVPRYFNPVGAHPSGRIGEHPSGVPNNLFPYVAQVAMGLYPRLEVFGNDYPTPDGTCVRDYLHVMDLAEGHAKALDYSATHPGLVTVNLGTGTGVSVLEAVAAFERASGKSVPYRFVPRRAGDAGIVYADPSLAARLLGWQSRRTLDQMCSDAWRWQMQNPRGYEPEAPSVVPTAER
jgi:UDP-glucose 4-epimerase